MEDEKACNKEDGIVASKSPDVVSEDDSSNSKEMIESSSAQDYTKSSAKENSKTFEFSNRNSPENSAMEGELDFEDEIREEKEQEDVSVGSVDDAMQKEILDQENTEEKHRSSGEEDGQLSADNESEHKENSVEEGEDDGELSDDDDLEEGEVKDSTPVTKQQTRQVCRFFNRGQCTWGNACRFLHLSVNEKGNYNMFAPSNKSIMSCGPPSSEMNILPMSGMGHLPQRAGLRSGPEYHPAPLPHPVPPPLNETASPVESAWERGMRQAKEMMKKANRRKEQEPDFEEKRLNLSIEENDRVTSEFDKENDFYGKPPPYRRQNDTVPFSRYDESEDMYDNGEREAREHWRGGRYDNFEVRWPRQDGQKDRRDRSRNTRLSTDREKTSRQLRGNKWRDERLSEVQSTRPRADEWRDPWRRSKTPKGRRSRSRIRSRGSYSSVSSHSYSERTSHSSYSYSRSSSRSSFYSSRSPSLNKTPYKRKSSPRKENTPLNKIGNRISAFKRKPLSPRRNRSHSFSRSHSSHSRSHSRSTSSRSRSATTRTPSISRSKSRSRSYSRSLSMDSVSSASSSISHHSEPKLGLSKLGPKDSATCNLFEEMAQRLQQFEKLRENQNTESAPALTSATGAPVSNVLFNIKSDVPDEPPEPELPMVPAIVERLLKEPPKPSVHNKTQIKLTLLNKPLPPKIPNPLKKELEIGKPKLEKEEVLKTGTKRALSPGSGKTNIKEKKSTSSRRDELLKQLKAVEDAIARKRAKFS